MDRDRRLAVSDFSRHVAVDASAGTGKTATLVARVTNLFLAERDLDPERVLLLTFTEKAAGEMKSRVTEGWELLLSVCREAATLEAAQEAIRAWNPLVAIPRDAYGTPADLASRASELADGVGRLSATTFHAFCRRLLLAFPAEAGVDPRFEVLPEGAAADAWDEGFRSFLAAEFGREAADPAWEETLSRAGRPEEAWGVVRRLCLSQRDLLAGDPPDFGTPGDFLSWLAREHAPADAWFRAFVAGIVDRDHEMTKVFEEALAVLSPAWDAVARGDLGAAAALAAAGAEAFSFRADRTKSRKAFPVPPGMTLAPARDALRKFFEDLAEVPAGDRAARFLFERARAALAHYEAAKRGRLDFMDLLLRASGLLADRPDVAARLAARFRHIFVDEFQDTDPLQARMLAALVPGAVGAPAEGPAGEGAGAWGAHAEDPAGPAPGAEAGDAAGAPAERNGGSPAGGGRLFLVGDPKQSIYGFRRADIQVYARFRGALVRRGGREISLVRNFRSRPDLVAAVNGLFDAVLAGGEDFSPRYAPVVAHRDDPGEGPPVSHYRLDEGVEEGAFLAALVRRIVGSVRVGGKGASAERPAAPRDVAILYRSDPGGEAVASWQAAFERAGIPLVVSARRGFYARPEVQDLRRVLQAVDAPEDPAARYAALKTVFFGLSDAEILPLLCGGPPVPDRARDAAALLDRLSARRGRATLQDLLADLFRETGVEFVAARLPEGERIVRNLAKAADLAREAEWAGSGSVKAFVAEIRRRAAGDREESEFPSFDEGEDAVRVSTIHAAKGLEFPVVILAGLSRGGAGRIEGLRVDRVRGLSALVFPRLRTYSAFRPVPDSDGAPTFQRWEEEKARAEELRLLYVAATRARDRLFLVEGGRGAGSAQARALRDAYERAAAGGDAGCPLTGFSGRRLLFPPPPLPAAGEGGEGAAAARGEGSASSAEDGGILLVPVPAPPDVPPPPLPHPADLSAAEAWEPPEEPSPGPLPAPVTVREFLDRERGRRFGEKVHLALEARPPVGAPWPPPGPLPPAVEWGEGEEERWAAIVRAVSGSALFMALRDAEVVGTEFPLLSCRGGRAQEERADLVVALPGAGGGREYRIVDYKTGRREAAEEAAYVRQLEGYAAILKEAWGVPVRAFLWYVETGESVEVPAGGPPP